MQEALLTNRQGPAFEGKPMTAMAPTRSTRTINPQCRIPLMADLTAAASARAVVADAIRTWRVPVDADVALLLTSELVTNAVTHGGETAGTFVLLTVACGLDWLRVDVHDGSGDLPVLDAGPDQNQLGPAEAETGRGLLLVTSLSAEWGFYRTPAGKAVYFTLDIQRGLPTAGCPDVGARSVS
jgi:anti-sigma regulatory factor (Ser/Thr protein kinase)